MKTFLFALSFVLPSATVHADSHTLKVLVGAMFPGSDLQIAPDVLSRFGVTTPVVSGKIGPSVALAYQYYFSKKWSLEIGGNFSVRNYLYTDNAPIPITYDEESVSSLDLPLILRWHLIPGFGFGVGFTFGKMLARTGRLGFIEKAIEFGALTSIQSRFPFSDWLDLWLDIRYWIGFQTRDTWGGSAQDRGAHLLVGFGVKF